MEFLVLNGVTFVIGVTIGYLVVSLSESFYHRYFGHASPSTRRIWKKLGVYRWIHRTFFTHNVVHHRLTFRRSFVSQFKDQADRQKVNEMLLNRQVERIACERYGLTISWVGILRYITPTLPFYAVLGIVLEPVMFLGSLLPLIIFPLMSKMIHPWIHQPYTRIQSHGGPFLNFLFKTRYMKQVVQNHYLHHKYQDSNFNLLLGGDILLGVSGRPSARELQEMRALGLLIE